MVALLALSGSQLNAAPQGEPSSTAVLHKLAKQTQPSYDRAAWAELKAKMSPAQRHWQTVLEQNLGDYYLPRYIQAKLAGEETAWDFVEDNPKLPRVLLIGDSISRGYTLEVRHLLAGIANVHRAPANCGNTAMGLKYLPIWLGTDHWDAIHFNFGIWDRKTLPAVYASNLTQIVEELQKTGAKLIWARTTPPASGNNDQKYTPEECDTLNRIADGIMHKYGIPEDDLYTAVVSRLAALQITNNVHFKNAGYEVLGRQVARSILARLNGGKTVELPVAVEKDARVQAHGGHWRFQKATIADPRRPRVLLIGDSILNGYLPWVIKGLDGRAYIDAWVNPYHQSKDYNKLLAEVLVANGPYDGVLINIGLHGWEPGRIKSGTFEPLTKGCIEVIQQKCPRAKIFWANTTPVMLKGKPGKLDPNINSNIIDQNRMAAKVMEEMHVPVENFYSLLVSNLDLGYGDGFHWRKPAYQILAKAAVDALVQALPAKVQP